MSKFGLLLVCLLWTSQPLKVWCEERVGDSKEKQDETVTRGLAYLKESGERWIDRRGCVSCHQIPSLLWSYQAASESGFAIVKTDLDRWVEWSTDVVSFVKPERKSDIDVPSAMEANIDTMVHLMLAIPRENDQQWRTQFAEALVSHQADNGSWKACGQLPDQKRPKDETTATTTLWATLALLQSEVEFDSSKAIQYADQVKQAVSTEWLAVRLLVADALDQPIRSSLQERLLDHQNDDGGWGWKLGDASDALGTGYAMYALANTGADPARLQSAREFLQQTQQESGRWKVPGTKSSSKGKATPTANDWGTAWAVIALTAVE